MLKGIKPNLRKLKRKINRSSESFTSLTQKEIDKFSAAEKYDLLLEDSNFSFTHNLLDKIMENHKRWRKTTWWAGICHGWPPASIKFHEPKESVSFQNSYGQKITFTPENIKALASFFISNSIASKRPTFLGNRCNLKKPKQNRRDHSVLNLTNYSRSKDECSDIEAADFHNILFNKVGIKKESFVVDIDYNAPVNNHPIAGYTMKVIDKSKSTPSFHTQVYYTNWTRPGLTRSHLPQDEQYLIKDYYYDLFIDEKSNIVSSK